MKLIKRDFYLNRLLAVKDVPDIKVITGVRRSVNILVRQSRLSGVARATCPD